LAHRLEGTINPEDYDEHDVALAEKEARPFLKKLEAAYSDMLGQLDAIKGDRPTLEKQRADAEALEVRLQEETEKYVKLADKAKEHEAAARLDGEKVGMALEAHDHAIARSTERVDALRKRREETAAFLGRLDRQRAPFDGENPPEAAIILAYPSAA
jgi:chromosome segregation ATPase